MDYIVYAKVNESGYITQINSSAFLSDLSGWTEIDCGSGDKYHHAQGNYFKKTLIIESRAYQYKLVEGKPVECTPEEIEEQESQLPPAPPSQGERISALETSSESQELLINTIMLGVAENYEQNLVDVTNLQQAVVEIYEMLIPPQPEG